MLFIAHAGLPHVHAAGQTLSIGTVIVALGFVAGAVLFAVVAAAVAAFLRDRRRCF